MLRIGLGLVILVSLFHLWIAEWIVSWMGQVGDIYKPPRSTPISLLCPHLSSHLHPQTSSNQRSVDKVRCLKAPLDYFISPSVQFVRFVRLIRSTQSNPSRTPLPPANMVATTSFTSFLILAVGSLFVSSTIAAPAPPRTSETINCQQPQ